MNSGTFEQVFYTWTDYSLAIGNRIMHSSYLFSLDHTQPFMTFASHFAFQGSRTSGVFHALYLSFRFIRIVLLYIKLCLAGPMHSSRPVNV